MCRPHTFEFRRIEHTPVPYVRTTSLGRCIIHVWLRGTETRAFDEVCASFSTLIGHSLFFGAKAKGRNALFRWTSARRDIQRERERISRSRSIARDAFVNNKPFNRGYWRSWREIFFFFHYLCITFINFLSSIISQKYLLFFSSALVILHVEPRDISIISRMI